jgi:hypothetical protein
MKKLKKQTGAKWIGLAQSADDAASGIAELRSKIEESGDPKTVLWQRVLALRFDDTPPILECDALRTLRPDDAGSDVWRVMNRVQEAVIKGGQRYHDAELRRRRVAPLRGIDVRISLNKSYMSAVVSETPRSPEP